MAKPTVAKKQFNYMMCEVLKERKKHMLASLHYNKRGDILFIFSAIITLLQAFLASLAQAEADRLESHQSSFNLTIAFLAAFSVFWQSLLKNWNYKGRATLHDSAAVALGKIYKTTRLKVREMKANEDEDESKDKKDDPKPDDLKPNEDEKEANETSNNMMHHSLVAQFEQATEGCTSLVPAKINAAFELLDNKIEVCKRKVYKIGTDEENANEETKVEWDSVYSTLYRELSAVIIKQSGWPFFLPDPEKVVNTAMNNYQKDEDGANGSLLQTVLKRNVKINKQYSEFTPAPSVDSAAGGGGNNPMMTMT